MNNTLWSQEDEDSMLHLWDAGVPLPAIADKLNRTPGAVLNRLQGHQRVYLQDGTWWIPRRRVASFKEVGLMNDAYRERIKLPGEQDPAKR